MNTNAEYLCKQLKDFHPAAFGPEETFAYDGIRLFSSSSESDEEKLIYVALCSEAIERRVLPSAACYVCIDDCSARKDSLSSFSIPVVLLRTNASPEEIFDLLLRNFFRSSQREFKFKEHLLDLMANGASMSTLLQEATKEYDNPFVVFDSNFSLVSHSVPPTLDLPQAQSVVNNKYANVDVLQKLADEGTMDTLQHSSRPTLVKLPNGYEKLVVNLFDNMECVGLIGFYNYIRNFEESDYDMVYYVAKLVKTYFHRNSCASSVWTPYDYIFNYLLTNEGTLNPKIINDLDVSFPPSMRIMTISFMNSVQIQDVTLKFIESSIQKMLPKSHSYIHFQNVIFLCRSASLEPDQNEKFFEWLGDFLSKYHLFAGISNSFSELSEFKGAYDEALSAASIGSSLDYKEPYFFYVDYTVFHMLRLFSKENDIKKFCHPAFKTLREYDQKYNTKYAECLLVYLKYNGNLTECANYFSIHYNSIKYRMKVIQDVCGIDLHDINTFIHLYISYMIHELFDNSLKLDIKLSFEDEGQKPQ